MNRLAKLPCTPPTVMNGLKIQNNSTKKVEGCDGDCMSCGKSGCSDRTQEQTA